MKTNLTVVIPTLNNVKGLSYLHEYFKDKQYKVVVIDNSKKNLGFAGGVNKGVRGTKTKWLLILNDDIEFSNDSTIDQLIAEVEKEKLDSLSPILRNPNGKVENFGYRVLPYGKIELIKSLSSLSSSLRNLDGLTAACLLIKTDIFKKLKGFDENFFAYLEDVDFFLRFKKAGYKMGISDIQVLHNHMTTTKTMGNFKSKQDMVNWWRLYIKHPDKFKFDLKFIIERLRNVSGFIKATFF
ncbi:glycosyltransferase family 2 protein [Candidatus Roizmanbacteria bacterium]|nr:glycosyltransferase family 2 protein [Candidatus Roizmanbacteria bacterium]